MAGIMDAGECRAAALAETQRFLAECLAGEAVAEQGFVQAEAAMWERRDRATALSDDDEAVEDFAEWLPQGRRQIAAAEALLDRAQADTSRARAMLAHLDQPASGTALPASA